MFAHIRTAAFIALFVGLSASATEPVYASTDSVFPADHVVTKMFQVRGRIMTPQGKPLANAIVAIVAPGSTSAVASTRTDAEGYYTLVLPPDMDTYIVRVISLGYTPMMTSALQREDADRVFLSDITLQPFMSTVLVSQSAHYVG